MRAWRRSAWLFCLYLAAANAKSRNRFEVFSGGRLPSPGREWVEAVPLDRPAFDPTPSSAISQKKFASGLSFLQGFSDVCSFRMSKCFANMMTGNSINCMAAIAEMRPLDALRLASIILCYSLGNGGYRAMVHLNHNEPTPNKTARAMASLLMIPLCALADYLFYSKTMTSKSLVHAVPLALGFGLLNAASMDALGGTITFAMTGHIKTISQGLADVVCHPDVEKRQWKSAQKTSTTCYTFFLLGLLVGSILVQSVEGTKIVGTGMTLPSFLLDDRVPIFTIIGILSAILVHFYDNPLPTPMRKLWTLVSDRVRKDADSKEDKIHLSVNFL